MPTGPGSESDVSRSNYRKSFSIIASSFSQAIGVSFQLGSLGFIFDVTLLIQDY